MASATILMCIKLEAFSANRFHLGLTDRGQNFENSNIFDTLCPPQ